MKALLGELSNSIRDIQGEYERQLDDMRDDMETRLQSQMQEQYAGYQKEALAMDMVMEERLKMERKLKDQALNMSNYDAEVCEYVAMSDGILINTINKINKIK
jgi:hypothetical protein